MKKVLLIGASGGVGRAVATRLIERGYHVIGTARDQDDLAATQAEIPDLKDLFVADFSDADTGKGQVEAFLAKNDARLYAVIGCAGVNPYGPLETTPLSMFRRIMEINALGNLAAFQIAMPHLRQSKGRFVFVSSVSGKVALPLLGHYTASKHALEGLADVMRLEAGQWGIPISLIEPGPISTPMLSSFGESLDARLQGMAPEEAANYGDYVRQFASLDPSVNLTADEVAETVIEALEAEHPSARYPIGTAVELFTKRREVSDAEMDAMISQMLPGFRKSPA